MSKYVQYTISVTVSVEEPLEDVMSGLEEGEEDITAEEIEEYIMQERWDFLRDSVDIGDWDIDVQLVDRDD